MRKMKILSIEIQNFLSFYDSNMFKFEDGPTIIIGQNKTGKSKLFDAFNWALYEKAFKTEEENWEKTKDWKDEIVNKYAKHLCKESDSVMAQVVLELIGDDDDSYIIDRSYRISKVNGKWDCPDNTELNFCKIYSDTGNSDPYYDKAAQDEILSLFPENLSKYFLFQGENIGQIMSLHKRSAFRLALNDLSQIKVFEIIRNSVNKTFNKIQDEFLNKESEDKQVTEQKKILSSDVESLSQLINSYSEQLETAKNEKRIANEELENVVGKLDQYNEISEKIQEIKGLNVSIKNAFEDRKRIINNASKSLFDNWMFAGSEKMIEKFLNIHKKGVKEKKYPERILQDFLREMLSEEVCKVCLTKAPKNSRKYKNISRLLDDNALNEDIAVINTLVSNASMYLKDVKEIRNEIRNFENDITKIDDSVKSLKNSVLIKEKELKELVPKKNIKLEEIENIEKLKDSRNKIIADLRKLGDNEILVNNKLLQYKEQKRLKNQELQELVERIGTTKEKARAKLAEKVKNIGDKFYETFYKKLINDIEKEANNCYLRMTELNRAISGRVKIDSENNEIYTVDEEGVRIFNINQANKVSLQISFIAAILAVSNKFWNRYFPFIADAPISALGGDNKVPAIDTISKIFKQSIILLKDDVLSNNQKAIQDDPVRRMIIQDKNIRKSYELTISKAKLEREQYTIIKELK